MKTEFSFLSELCLKFVSKPAGEPKTFFHKKINKYILSGLPVSYSFFLPDLPKSFFKPVDRTRFILSEQTNSGLKWNRTAVLARATTPLHCFTAHNHETLNRPFSAVLTDSVLIKTSLHMLRQLPRPITNDQLIIIAPLFLFFPLTSSPQTNLGRIPLRCQHIRWLLHFRLKTASETVFPKH